MAEDWEVDDDHEHPFCSACGTWHADGACDLDPANNPPDQEDT